MMTSIEAERYVADAVKTQIRKDLKQVISELVEPEINDIVDNVLKGLEIRGRREFFSVTGEEFGVIVRLIKDEAE